MKKFLCLLACMVTCLSTTVFAAVNLTDIKGTKYEDAVDKLVYFEIVNGYEDNTFKPKNSVTRAELSKMLVLAMGKEDSVAAAKNKFLSFSDVLSSFWGYGYIKVASDEKLVNGYTDGTFKPNGNVTYAEAATMVLRALGYKEDIEKSELLWPNNYMVYGDEKLELFKDMGEFKAGDPATRGDIAILIWNALRTGVCDIVGENSKGLVYGEGTPMITEYLGYKYIEDAEIANIEFDDNFVKARVAFDIGKKKYTYFDFNAEEVLEMFGCKVTMLIDDVKDKVVDIECEGDYKRVEGDVTNITENKIYVANRRNGYDRPDDEDVLLFGINSLEEAAEVILLIEDSVVEYCIGKGATDVELAIVTSASAKVNNATGIKIRDIGSSSNGSSYLLANEDKWPSTNDIILYYINSEDYLVILDNIKETGSAKISTVTDEYLKIAGSDYYEYDDEDDYTVVVINGRRTELGDLEDISTANDMMKVVTYNAHMYFFVYKDAILDNLDESKVDALEALEEAIWDAEDMDEAICSQESFTILMFAVREAKAIDHTYSVARITRATAKIKEALDNMDPAAGKTEKAIVAAKKELRELYVDEGLYIIEEEDKYTVESYDVFYDAMEEVEDVLYALSADLEEIEEAYELLEDAIYELEERD